MAIYPELKGPPLDAYRGMVRVVKDKAMKELNLGENELITRDIRPDDLKSSLGGTASDYYFGQTALTWTTVVNDETIGDNRFVGINGIWMSGTMGASQAAPIQQIRITRKGSVSRYWNVAQVSTYRHQTGWVDDPVTVDQNTTLKVETLGRAASSITNFQLLGVVVEKRGLLINP